MEKVLFVSITVFGILLRLLYSLSSASDENVTFWLIKRQEKSRWVNYDVPDSIIEGFYGYPVLIQFLVGKLPSGVQVILGRIFNILPDVLIGIALYIIAKIYYNSFGLLTLTNSLMILKPELIVTFFYLSSPVLLPSTSRMKTIKGRSWGGLFVFFYLIFVFYFLESHKYIFLLPIIFLGLLIILTSLFAFQVLILFTLFLSCIEVSFYPVLTLALVFIISFVFPKIKAKEPIIFFLNHKIWYWRNYSKGTTASPRRNLRNLVLLPYYLFKRPALFCRLIYNELPPAIFILSMPELIIILFLLLKKGNLFIYFAAMPIFSFSWKVVLISVVIFMFVCFRRLSFMGQAERYSEYSIPFLSLLVPYFYYKEFGYTTALNLLAVLMLLHVLVIMSNFLYDNKALLFQREPEKDEDVNEMLNWMINNNVGGENIFTIPVKLGFQLSYLAQESNVSSNLKFYYKFIKKNGEWGFKYYEEDTGGLVEGLGGLERSKEVLKIGPERLRKQYNAGHILIDKSYLGGLREEWGDFIIKNKVAHENGQYLLVEMKDG